MYFVALARLRAGRGGGGVYGRSACCALVCTSLCMSQDLQALGICMHRAHGQGSCVAHPSAFTAQWTLKLGPPLHLAWAVQDVNLGNLYTSVVTNSLPFIRSYGDLLMSCAAWITMGLLCGHSATCYTACRPLCIDTCSGTRRHWSQPEMYCRFNAPLPCPKTTSCFFDLLVAPALCLLGWLSLCIVTRRPRRSPS